MKLDLNFILNNIKGEPATGVFDQVHAGAVVGSTLAYVSRQHPEMSPMKRTVIGQALYKKEIVEVDKSELNAIKEIIRWPESGYSPIIISQIDEAIDKLFQS